MVARRRATPGRERLARYLSSRTICYNHNPDSAGTPFPFWTGTSSRRRVYPKLHRCSQTSPSRTASSSQSSTNVLQQGPLFPSRPREITRKVASLLRIPETSMTKGRPQPSRANSSRLYFANSGASDSRSKAPGLSASRMLMTFGMHPIVLVGFERTHTFHIRDVPHATGTASTSANPTFSRIRFLLCMTLASGRVTFSEPYKSSR